MNLAATVDFPSCCHTNAPNVGKYISHGWYELRCSSNMTGQANFLSLALVRSTSVSLKFLIENLLVNICACDVGKPSSCS